MIIVTTTVNFAYLTGVWLETYERFKAVIKCGDYTAVVIPALDVDRVSGNVYPYRDGEDPAEALRQAVANCIDDVVYIDGGTTLRHFEIIKRALPQAQFKLADDLLKEWRAIKRRDEVEKIKAAAVKIRRVIESLETTPGVSERQFAARIYTALYEEGLAPGPILVQFGSNTAMPHLEPTDKKLRRGDAVVLDISASYGGYYADLTKSFFYGEPPDEYLKIYDIVKKAQQAVLNAVRSGARAADVDKAAREVIEAMGYGPYFIHRTGHGLGLEIHEAPDISPNSSDVLKPGMVFTIEPGVYIPGKYGVRLEIDVYLSEGGAEVL
ncbi:peptidase M24 [Pyrobaculum islandicum DSM 4184]|uniref:Peptidase M24 n=1 Tax=Pyrobaculum islandicum (strain DSM 4184 / JCM 9189 / GEO3) TaxID=384616 RepID=A1RVK2_PYRIL|nr:Xaa-Pro peptidase family protein [Pyrobaculum islandicum]ABL88984.1 peptidase M24 [Pyrobaculum islandicum DSM 4184]